MSKHINRYTVSEASKILRITKQTIYDKIKRNTIEWEVIEGIKYIIINKADSKPKSRHNTAENIETTKQNLTKYESKYMTKLEEENREIKRKIAILEDEVRTLNQKLNTEKDKTTDILQQAFYELKQLKQVAYASTSKEQEPIVEVQTEEKPKKKKKARKKKDKSLFDN
jgi:excisionase family DNA binding protein